MSSYIEIQAAHFKEDAKEESGFLPLLINTDQIAGIGETLGAPKEWLKVKHLYGYTIMMNNGDWLNVDQESYERLKCVLIQK